MMCVGGGYLEELDMADLQYIHRLATQNGWAEVLEDVQTELAERSAAHSAADGT